MINIPKVFLSFLGHGFKNSVSRGMAESIIHSFEMVQVKYADGKRMDSPVHEGFFMFQNFVHLAPVEYLSQVIYYGQLLDGGKGMGYLSPELCNVSANK